uniref:Uncharacterized protein n=1 Tax=viral metagenome TaxID=1070528 RepID=A0A6C0AQ78_9ZZZZ
MEIAIPLIALGGMYVVSNQTNENCADREIRRSSRQERFTNMGIRSNLGVKDNTGLPNTNIPPQNFPVSNINQLVDTVQQYPNPNTATDKYFNQNLYQEQVRSGGSVNKTIPNVYSLSGNYLNSDQFKHNNMVPFYGGKVKGKTYDVNITESVLDNMMGTGSQTIKKIEQAPLFKPEQNVQWTFGMPNQSDFYQSRVNPAMKNNNVKPFDSIMVGPGLDKGYGFDGSNGYNSGMEARDKWLPKTVDQLRVDTNPKLEYELLNHEGPANSFIKNVPTAQMIGRVEKQRPDTYFINTQDRWLTTTGAEKGETLRPIQEMGILRRNDIPIDYMGPAISDIRAGTAPENFEPSRRIQLPCADINPSSAMGRGPINDGDNFLRSHTNYENHRSTMKQPDTLRSGFSGAVGAVIAPLLDIFRPTKKDETINNIRIYGEASTTVPKGYVYNPQDTTPTTIKETTLHSQSFNINNQREGLYVNNYTSPDLTQRDTTSSEYYTAAGGYATGYGDMSYDAAYKQHNNDIKSQTIVNRPNQGGTQIFNQQMNLTTIKSDTDRLDGRFNPAFSRISGIPPSTQTYGAIRAPQYYNECASCDRIQPDILSAFKNNPYTHSLTSSV